MQELMTGDEHGRVLGSTKNSLCDIEVGPLSSSLSAPMKQLNFKGSPGSDDPVFYGCVMSAFLPALGSDDNERNWSLSLAVH